MREVNKSNGFSSPFFSGDSWSASEEVGKIIRERERAIEEEKKWEGVCDNRTREECCSPGTACRSTESSEMQRF